MELRILRVLPAALTLLPLLLILAACGGGGGGSAPPVGGGPALPSGLTITGKVYDLSTPAAAPAGGVSVTLRNAAGSTIASATSAADGSYTLSSVPASTEVYFSASKAGFVTTHSSIQTFAINDSFSPFVISPPAAKAIADAIAGSVVGSAWSDAAYQSLAWFGIDSVNAAGNQTPGMAITPAIADSTVKYNDGNDQFRTVAPTIASNNLPLVGGFSGTERLHQFNTSFGRSFKLPLFKGAISYNAESLVGRTLLWSALTSATANTILAMAASDATAVAVGAQGTILSSADGSSWTTRASNVNANLNGIAWSGTKFVAVGDGGTILSSSDGSSWSAQASATGNRLRGIAWTGTQFIAVGDAGTIITSSDGSSWSAQSSGVANDLYAVAGHAAMSVAVGGSATGGYGTILSSSNGQNWSNRSAVAYVYIPIGLPAGATANPGDTLYSVVWTGSQFVIGGDTATNNVTGNAATPIQTSPDGQSWTFRRPALFNVPRALAWSGAQLVSASNGSTLQTSADGIFWDDNLTDGTDLNAVTWFKGRFLAGGAGGKLFAGALDTSKNGQVLENSLNAVAASASQLVAVGALGTVLSSTDGINFSAEAAKVNVNLNGVASSGTIFVAVGDLGTIITSPDQTSWTRQSSGTGVRLRAITWTGSQFICVGDGGTILTSTNGSAWTAQTSGTTQDLYGVAGSTTQNVVVGALGTLLSSNGGANWISRTSQSGNQLRSVVWSGSQFLIAGDNFPVDNRKFQTSTDGINWNGIAPAVGNGINAVVWSGSKYLAVGTVGVVQTSTDGLSWTQLTFGSPDLNGVTYFKGNFIAVGNVGTIVSGP